MHNILITSARRSFLHELIHPLNFKSFSGSPTMLLESEEGRKGLDRRSRPSSTGEMETSFERDTQEEFETIKEEDSGNLEDNKSPG